MSRLPLALCAPVAVVLVTAGPQAPPTAARLAALPVNGIRERPTTPQPVVVVDRQRALPETVADGDRVAAAGLAVRLLALRQTARARLVALVGRSTIPARPPTLAAVPLVLRRAGMVALVAQPGIAIGAVLAAAVVAPLRRARLVPVVPGVIPVVVAAAAGPVRLQTLALVGPGPVALSD